jgi:hypothetical protein
MNAEVRIWRMTLSWTSAGGDKVEDWEGGSLAMDESWERNWWISCIA